MSIPTVTRVPVTAIDSLRFSEERRDVVSFVEIAGSCAPHGLSIRFELPIIPASSSAVIFICVLSIPGHLTILLCVMQQGLLLNDVADYEPKMCNAE